MLPKENRLKKKKDFERVFKKGKIFKEDFLILKKAKNNLTVSRFGFIVGKKTARKATQRNKIKRQLRGLIRMKLPKINRGLDIILMVNPGFEAKKFSEIREIINKILNKAEVLKKT